MWSVSWNLWILFFTLTAPATRTVDLHGLWSPGPGRLSCVSLTTWGPLAFPQPCTLVWWSSAHTCIETPPRRTQLWGALRPSSPDTLPAFAACTRGYQVRWHRGSRTPAHAAEGRGPQPSVVSTIQPTPHIQCPLGAGLLRDFKLLSGSPFPPPVCCSAFYLWLILP